ncbi:MAG: FlgD immunoglobulin-like domain containing protein [Candidatus Latescibacterota bacterium]
MKNMRLAVCLALFLSAGVSRAGELPQVVLQEGDNPVTVSFLNRWDADLSQLTVETEKGALPVWLTIRNMNQSVAVPKGERGKEKLTLNFLVHGAQPGEASPAPIMVRDNRGHRWNFTVLARVTGEAASKNALYENYPNPFNPSTTVRFALKENRHASLVIYNMLGQKVKTLVDAPRAAGMHTVQWDGKNDKGQAVSSGTYFFRLTSGSFVQTRRMMLVE